MPLQNEKKEMDPTNFSISSQIEGRGHSLCIDICLGSPSNSLVVMYKLFDGGIRTVRIHSNFFGKQLTIEQFK